MELKTNYKYNHMEEIVGTHGYRRFNVLSHIVVIGVVEYSSAYACLVFRQVTDIAGATFCDQTLTDIADFLRQVNDDAGIETP